MSVKAQDGATLPRLAGIMRRLLAPGGCPWDREQTLGTLKRYAIEEAFEVCDALDNDCDGVFGDTTVAGVDEVLANWEKIKLAEKKDRGALDGIPRALPALSYALRMGDKASRVGFDWPDPSGPRAKVDEELRELDEAVAAGDKERVTDELGDALFSLVSLARKLGGSGCSRRRRSQGCPRPRGTRPHRSKNVRSAARGSAAPCAAGWCARVT